jgi:Holliday junction DNA helicase RuvA
VEKLVRIPGVGKKTAERMVLELRDKLPVATGASEMNAAPTSPVEQDVISALVNLGYQRAAADKAAVAARGGKGAQNFEGLFREALQSLSK